jgi:hypothetical protein
MSFCHGTFSKDEALEIIIGWAKEQIELVAEDSSVSMYLDNFVGDTATVVISKIRG